MNGFHHRHSRTGWRMENGRRSGLKISSRFLRGLLIVKPSHSSGIGKKYWNNSGSLGPTAGLKTTRFRRVMRNPNRYEQTFINTGILVLPRQRSSRFLVRVEPTTEAWLPFFGTSWHILALSGTFWHPVSWRRMENTGKSRNMGRRKRLSSPAERDPPGFSFPSAGAGKLADIRRSATRNYVKERPGGSDKSLLKLYYFFTGSGFFWTPLRPTRFPPEYPGGHSRGKQ